VLSERGEALSEVQSCPAHMKKTKNKILSFPPPTEPVGQTIICQIGGDRFAIHMEIEDLPPPAPVIQFQSPPRKDKRSN
jgi:hypothetical protein